MYLINRAVVVELKQPFLDWVNSTRVPKFTLKSVNRESHAYLLPEHNTQQELELIIQDIYPEIFKAGLGSFCRNKGLWPKINYQNFLDFFDINTPPAY